MIALPGAGFGCHSERHSDQRKEQMIQSSQRRVGLGSEAVCLRLLWHIGFEQQGFWLFSNGLACQ